MRGGTFSCSRHSRRFKPSTTSLQRARDRFRQTHGFCCRSTGHNAFDTGRSPGYQGYKSCHSFQQGPVSKHNHIPSLCSFSTGGNQWRKTSTRTAGEIARSKLRRESGYRAPKRDVGTDQKRSNHAQTRCSDWSGGSSLPNATTGPHDDQPTRPSLLFLPSA